MQSAEALKGRRSMLGVSRAPPPVMAAGVAVPPPPPLELLPLPEVVEGAEVVLPPSLPPELQARLARASPESVKPIQSHFMMSEDPEVRCVMLPLVPALFVLVVVLDPAPLFPLLPPGLAVCQPICRTRQGIVPFPIVDV